MLEMLQLNLYDVICTLIYTTNLKISYNVIEEIFTLGVLGENEIGFWNGKIDKKELKWPKEHQTKMWK